MSEHIKTGEEIKNVVDAVAFMGEEKWVSFTWLIKKIEGERSDKRRPLQYKHAMSNLKQEIIDEVEKP